MLINPFNRHARPGSLSEALKSQEVKMAGHLGAAAVDTYVASLPFWQPAAAYTPALAGWMAAGHAAYGVFRAFPLTTNYWGELVPRDIPKRDLAVGVGHLITAGGLAGMAAGLGPVAVPVIAVGQVTALLGEFLSKDKP